MESPKEQKSQTGRDAICILLLAMVLMLAYMGALRFTGCRADLAESNMQANLIRINRYLNLKAPQNVLVGSSVAGRLLPEYFTDSNTDVVNLGLDGSRPLFAFEILSRHPEKPARLLLDTSTLFQPISANDVVMREAMKSPTVSLAEIIPILRPDSRPSSLLYDRLKTLKEVTTGGTSRAPFGSESVKAPVEIPSTYSSLRDALNGFRDEGIEVVFVEIPRGPGWAAPSKGWAPTLAEELNVKFLEPGPEIFRAEGDVLRFSDGFHLDGPSARKVAHYIGKSLVPDE